ncbi:hypothetical protein F4604DRAFT_1581467, partial [Suillus subluteus]
LDIRNSDRSLMTFICGALPTHIPERLTDNLISCFDSEDIFQPQSFVINVDPEPFECVHFSWWNKYATKGQDALKDVHPHQLTSMNGERVNYNQMLPYPSVELKYHLPDEYNLLVEVVDLLPGQEFSPVRPFLSLVLNINVCTMAHCDTKDKEFCLVLPIRDFQGGALVTYEQGLAVELRGGDFMIFRSCSSTHFNLVYEGRRTSIILHTDQTFDQWKEDRNGWQGHPYFN